jgi:hypothetical protein
VSRQGHPDTSRSLDVVKTEEVLASDLVRSACVDTESHAVA